MDEEMKTYIQSLIRDEDLSSASNNFNHLQVRFPIIHIQRGSQHQSLPCMKGPMEHLSRFHLQCGEHSKDSTLMAKMFPASFKGTAFSWFVSLAPKSITSWEQLSTAFIEQFQGRKK